MIIGPPIEKQKKRIKMHLNLQRKERGFFFVRRHHHLVTLKFKTLTVRNVKLETLNVFLHAHLNVLNPILPQLIY